jgi:hypothetical protein
MNIYQKINYILTHILVALLQDQPKESSSLEEWMFIHQNHAMQHQQLSDTSSLGIRTPDIGITDMMMTTNSQLFNGGGYTSFLQPSPILQHHLTDDNIQLIPSLCVSCLKS